MDENQMAVENIINYINDEILRKINNIPYDQTIQTKVLRKISNVQYIVIYKGQEYDAFTLNNTNYSTNDIVWTTVPCGNWAHLLILGREVF